ncbi:Rho-binding antiterminator [Shewanella sp.]|uniref:Rho-binding antiterminator n=1 Tax=Shewanella sp. TaxID=50422 RepID=UPI004048E382
MKSIKCEHYDYIEIMCLYQYHVRLTLHSGNEIVGRFNNIVIVQGDDQNYEAICGYTTTLTPQTVILTDIKLIEVLSTNSLFTHLTLSE